MRTLVVGFDLDMTLIDSHPGIVATYEALAAETSNPIDIDVAIGRLALPPEQEVIDWFAPDEVAAAANRFHELYLHHGVPAMALLPGAMAAVSAVHAASGRVIVVTAAHESNSLACLQQVGLNVDAVIGDRLGPEKGPVLKGFGASVYVGDSPFDMEGALAGGAVAVAVCSGSYSAGELRRAGAKVILGSLEEFPAWLRSHRRAVEQKSE